MEAAESICRYLDAQDVETVFSLMSDDIMAVTSRLKRDWADDIEVVENRHEQLATAMATAYAEHRDDIGVCILGRGPAIAQTGTALVTAKKQQSSLLVLTATSPTTAADDIKGFPQETYLETMAGSVESVQDPAALLPTLDDAFHRLRHGEGPVVIQVAKDVFDAEVASPVEPLDDVGPGTSEPVPATPTTPSDEAIEAVVDRYLDSGATRPPVILVGRGAVESRAREAIESLAERTSTVIVTTLRAQGYHADHPFAAGFAGTIGSNLANELLNEAAFVLAVGASLNDHTTDHGRLFAEDATIVHVDTDPASIQRHTAADLGVVGDATATVEAIEAALAEMGIDFEGKFWTTNLERRIADYSPFSEGNRRGGPECFDPRDLLEGLDLLLPDERTVVIDAGHFSYWVFDGITIPGPDSLVWPMAFASIGLGLPSGVGTAMADTTERTTVTFCGDAGFMMSLQALDTAVRYDVPMVVVVMNDEALGAEYAQLTQQGGYADAGLVESPDIAALASGFGAEGHTVRTPADLDAIEGVLSTPSDGPVVLDCYIDRSVIHRRFR